MFKDGKWKIQLKRNGRYIDLGFSNLILNDGLNFNFDYSVNNTTDSIITHMFLGATHGDVKATDTTMASVPIAAVGYTDYIKPNYDNPLASIYENTLVFKYYPTETVTIRQLGTGRVTGANTRRFFSIANILDENGERAALELKPGDELTFTYVLTIIGHFLEGDHGFYDYAMASKSDFNNVLKANPNWSLAGYQRQLNSISTLVSEHLGVPVTPTFAFVIDYGNTSGITGQPFKGVLYEVRWTTVSGNPLTGVDGAKFQKEFYPNMVYPWARTFTNRVPPTGSVWKYTQLMYITNGVTAVDRFDHTKVAAIPKPKLPTSFNYKLVDANYNYGIDPATFARWEVELAGGEPLSQVVIVQNNAVVLPATNKLLFVSKKGTFKDQFKITNLKRNVPFFIHFFNRAGMTKYGPLFVNSVDNTLKAELVQPVYNKGANVADYYYPNSDYYNGYFYIRPFGRITNDLGNKTIFVHLVSDNTVPSAPADYTEINNQSSSRVSGLYTVHAGSPSNLLSLINLPNSCIRVKLKRDDVEFFEIPLKLKEIDTTPYTQAFGNNNGYDAVIVDFKFKKL